MNNKVVTNAIDDNKLNSLRDDLKSLMEEFYKFRDETHNSIKIINEVHLPKKADKDELRMLESKIVDKLHELID